MSPSSAIATCARPSQDSAVRVSHGSLSCAADFQTPTAKQTHTGPDTTHLFAKEVDFLPVLVLPRRRARDRAVPLVLVPHGPVRGRLVRRAEHLHLQVRLCVRARKPYTPHPTCVTLSTHVPQSLCP
eukprot:1491-Rhodomonas_salina.3